jgi:hypothetical protein
VAPTRPAPGALTPVVRAALHPGPGRGPRVTGVQRLRGGSQKGVYRLALDDGRTVACYIWSDQENYWPAAAPRAPTDPFGGASGAGLFEASHAQLDRLGVRTPRVYLLDRGRSLYPDEIALVEDVRGGNLEEWLERGEPGAPQTLGRLGDALTALHGCRSQSVGKAEVVARGLTADRPCAQIVLDRALGDLAEAANRVERVAAVRDRLETALAGLATLPPRAEHALIHGELGPDHVLVDGHGHPVLIDIEGVMFFDVEWEHAFLELRFGEHYRRLRPAPGVLEEPRLRLYRLAMYLSLVAGPLRLLDGDFPDRTGMLAIAEANIGRTLAFLGSASGQEASGATR